MHNYNVCIYISGGFDECVHRVAMPGVVVKKWPVNEICNCLSVTDAHSLLVTCGEARMVKEFSTDGKLLRQIELPQNVIPWHTIQLSSGEFLVCYDTTDDDDPVGSSCVYIRDSNGHVVKSYGGPRDVPVHLAVDRNGFVFVADMVNCRVLLLSPSLDYVSEVALRQRLKLDPLRLFLDVDRRRLYVAVNKRKDGRYTAGRVVVFSV